MPIEEDDEPVQDEDTPLVYITLPFVPIGASLGPPDSAEDGFRSVKIPN